jgi:hypothetical protein
VATYGNLSQSRKERKVEGARPHDLPVAEAGIEKMAKTGLLQHR